MPYVVQKTWPIALLPQPQYPPIGRFVRFRSSEIIECFFADFNDVFLNKFGAFFCAISLIFKATFPLENGPTAAPDIRSPHSAISANARTVGRRGPVPSAAAYIAGQ